MIARVGLVVGLVLALVGYAAKVTYEQVIQGGIVHRGDFDEVDLKSMSNFDMDQVRGTVADVPPQFRALDGKKVLLVGEVAPTNDTASNKISKFSLCYSVAKCCYGGPPKVQHFVACRVPAGRTVTNYVNGPAVKVFGTLHVKAESDGDTVTSIYQLDVDRVEPVS
jgi:hypothetical protein